MGVTVRPHRAPGWDRLCCRPLRVPPTGARHIIHIVEKALVVPEGSQPSGRLGGYPVPLRLSTAPVMSPSPAPAGLDLALPPQLGTDSPPRGNPTGLCRCPRGHSKSIVFVTILTPTKGRAASTWEASLEATAAAAEVDSGRLLSVPISGSVSACSAAILNQASSWPLPPPVP